MSDPILLWHADPNEPLRGDSGAVVRGLGIDERMPSWVVDRPQGTSDYLIVHFHDPVQILLNGDMRNHPAHTCVVWPPHTSHRFGSARPWSHSWILCDGLRVKSGIEASGLNFQEPIAQSGADAALRYLRLIHGELIQHQEPDPQIIEGLLSLWLREAFRDSLQQSLSYTRIPARLLAIRQMIDSDPAKPVALAHLARQSGLSVSQFSAEFRRCFGTSPIAYVLRLRLRRAMYLLSDRNLSISEVARRCGFTDQRYFARQFKAQFGATPRACR